MTETRTFNVFGIQYDTDGEAVTDLPRRLTITLPADADPVEALADAVLDRTGWCIAGLEFEERREPATGTAPRAALHAMARHNRRSMLAMQPSAVLADMLTGARAGAAIWPASEPASRAQAILSAMIRAEQRRRSRVRA